MTAKSYSLTYDGNWRESNFSSVPEKSGVYTVYACRYDKEKKTVSIRKLIYIGEAGNVRDRVLKHEKLPIWRQHLAYGEEICVNFAEINIDRERVEAALINHHKPPENTEYVNNFPFDQTTVSTSGENTLLSDEFTVKRSSR